MTPAQRRDWRRTILGHPDVTPAQKIVLLALETFADYPEGTNARPGADRLARTCGLKLRAVEGALRLGIELGVIERTARANPKRGLAAVYCLISSGTTMPVDSASIGTAVPVESAFLPARNEFQPARNDVSTGTTVQPTKSLPRENTKGALRLPDETSRCGRHRGMLKPPSCNVCKQIRISEQQSAGADAAAIRDEAAHRRRRCRMCDEAGWLLGEDGTPSEPARKCSHDVSAVAS